MRLLLLNINYLRYQFFVKIMQKNIMDFEHSIAKVSSYPKLKGRRV